ncbi:MAG TPA: hypothetical protein VKT49_02485 [Bryobacteraceae bacterium]|nr:hypothetical protein [Bryobacteraceae bacterium]
MLTYKFSGMAFAIVALILSAAAPHRAVAQSPIPSRNTGNNSSAQQVELAVPFGQVDGQLVINGPYLMFLDSQQSAASFVIPRDDVRNLTATGSEMTLDLARPVQDRGGATNRLVFRLANPEGGLAYNQWFHQTAVSPTGEANRTPDAAPRASAPGTLSLQVKHDHRIGSDMGSLLITPDQMAYESVTNVKDSRQWNYSDIKEIHQDGPYKLKIVPFSGDVYNFDLLGQGLAPDQFQMLVDRVAKARLTRH